MIKIVAQISSALLWIAGLIGAFTLPEDMQVASERLGQLSFLANRENILIGLFAVSGILALYSIVSPKIEVWRKNRRTPPLIVEFDNDCNLEHKHPYPFKRQTTYFSPGDPPASMYKTEVFIAVSNSTDKTINGVNVRVHYSGIPLSPNVVKLSSEEGGSGKVDIEPEGREWFMLGYYIRPGMAMTMPTQQYSQEQIKTILEQHEHYGILVPNSNKTRETPHLRNDGIKFYIQVLGENVKSTYAEFLVNTREKDEVFLVRQSNEEWKIQ